MLGVSSRKGGHIAMAKTAGPPKQPGPAPRPRAIRPGRSSRLSVMDLTRFWQGNAERARRLILKNLAREDLAMSRSVTHGARSGRHVIMAVLVASTLVAVVPSPAQAVTPEPGLATWNIQSKAGNWADVGKLVNEHKTDVVALQEVPKNPPAGAKAVQTGGRLEEYEWNIGSTSRPNIRYLYVLREPSKNLGLVTKWQPGTANIKTITGPYRPLLCVNDTNTSTLFCSAHASASGGGDAAALVRNTANEAKVLNIPNWAVLADFNRAPDDLAKDKKLPSAAHIYRPNDPTQLSGGELDYMVSNVDSDWRRGHVEVARSGASDHWAVVWSPKPN